MKLMRDTQHTHRHTHTYRATRTRSKLDSLKMKWVHSRSTRSAKSYPKQIKNAARRTLHTAGASMG